MPYDIIASAEAINKTVAALTAKKYTVVVAADKAEALSKLKEIIPAGAGVMTGGSVTLDQIGLTDLLKSGASGWTNWKDKIFSEKDSAKQMVLRRASGAADYYLASAHALSEDGVIVQASGTGSQLPAFAFDAGHAVYVVGAQKIVPTEVEAVKRVREYVLPLEDAHQKSLGNAGSQISKLLITYADVFPGRVTVILVKEKLGF